MTEEQMHKIVDGVLEEHNVPKKGFSNVHKYFHKIPSNVIRGLNLIKSKGRSVRPIKLREFDIGNSCDCVLGQIYGSFWDGVEAVGLRTSRVGATSDLDAKFGFNLFSNLHRMEEIPEYEVRALENRTGSYMDYASFDTIEMKILDRLWTDLVRSERGGKLKYV